jgi:TPR repeat protein
VDALYNLGTCYETGYGVVQDLDEALRLYKRAAAKGHAGAAAAAGAMEARRV